MTLPPDSTSSSAPVVPQLEPELAAVFTVLSAALPKSITADDITRLRTYPPDWERPTPETLRRGGRFVAEDRIVPGPPGEADISLLICRPTDVTVPTGVLYHTHGGGFFAGENRDAAAELLDWAQELGIALVAVEYRLAPETPHPGPVEDCYAGLTWIAQHATDLNIDPERIVVAGGSAGGALAAALALMARDRGGPALLGQMLLSPMLDDRIDTPSMRMDSAGIWDWTSANTAWTALLGDARGGPDVSAYAAPARAADLSGLPPAFIDVGSAETFRDEAVTYAGRIWQAGGQAELHVWPGAFHGFYVVAPHAAISVDAKTAQLQWLHRVFNP